MSSLVLVVDDDPAICELLARALTRLGYRVTTSGSGEDALALLSGPDFADCLLVDKFLPGMNGAEVMAEARRRVPGLPVVLMTAHPEPLSLGEERPDALLTKPFRSLEAIEEAVASAIDASTGETPLGTLRERLTQVVSEISPLRKKRE